MWQEGRENDACRSRPLSCISVARTSHFLGRSAHVTGMTAFPAPAWSSRKCTHVSVTSGNMCCSLITHIPHVGGGRCWLAGWCRVWVGCGITLDKSWRTGRRGPRTQIRPWEGNQVAAAQGFEWELLKGDAVMSIYPGQEYLLQPILSESGGGQENVG